MLDDEKRWALLVQFTDEALNSLASVVHSSNRFVEQEDIEVGRDATREFDELQLSARKIRRWLIDEVSNLEPFEERFGAYKIVAFFGGDRS